MNTTFNPQLKTKYSHEYTSLKDKVETSLLAFVVAENFSGVETFDVTKFRNGSVIAEFDIINIPAFVPEDSYATQLEIVINKGINNGNLSSINADPAFSVVVSG